jgi:hypothetical protein
MTVITTSIKPLQVLPKLLHFSSSVKINFPPEQIILAKCLQPFRRDLNSSPLLLKSYRLKHTEL